MPWRRPVASHEHADAGGRGGGGEQDLEHGDCPLPGRPRVRARRSYRNELHLRDVVVVAIYFARCARGDHSRRRHRPSSPDRGRRSRASCAPADCADTAAPILVEVLSEVDGHVTGAELVERCRMRDPDTIPSTVYRTLDVLEELGVIRHSHGADGREEFHVLPAAEHAHLYCRVRRVVGTVERRPHGRDGGRCRPDRSRLPGRRAAPDAHRRLPVPGRRRPRCSS